MIATVLSIFRRHGLLAGAILLILSPALLDFRGLSDATKDVAHTRDALIGLVGILVTARLVDAWSKRRTQEQDKDRFRGISTIAFRSLSQTVNDVGRMLLAPLVGADLYSAGIPGFEKGDHATNLATLGALGIQPQPHAISGFWDQIDDHKLGIDLTALCSQPEFAELMFRVTSSTRRRLQACMADWAPVMVTVPEANEELEPGWELSDQLVLLAESWRSLAAALTDRSSLPATAEIDRVRGHYFTTIQQYRSWLEVLQQHAKLPTKGFITQPQSHP
ncbi:hypothetical protein QMG61_03895 [Cryobacterium sp. PH31-AA6]|uniref:hypothetical protein n=1 Tax=Cryobacterium sp. PH31-AA6 TaxID=3046205 RepID=UPI0024BBDCA2|nr:hypothetical protein [Cryobacterium sp. PH31-AA6]MDJ0322906.1 hypothetical protein [Cryobacterium sp. PH31-AA6]